VLGALWEQTALGAQTKSREVELRYSSWQYGAP